MALSSFFPKTANVKKTAFQKKGKGNAKGGGKAQSPAFQKKGKGNAKGGGKAQSSQGKLTYECEVCNKGYGSFEGAEGCEKRCKQKTKVQSKPHMQVKPHMQKKPEVQNRAQVHSKPQGQNKPQLHTKAHINVQKPGSSSPTTLFECEVCNKQFHGRIAAEACEKNCKAAKRGNNAQKGAPHMAKISTPNKAMFSCELCNKSFPSFQAAENCEKGCKAKRGKGAAMKTNNGKGGNGGSFNNKAKGGGKAPVKVTINKSAGNSQGGFGGGQGGIKCPKCSKSFSNKFVADGHIRACKL